MATEVYIVLGLFLGLTVLIGFVNSRKVRTFEDFAFGSGKMHTGILAMSFLATYICAGDLMMSNYFAKDGIMKYVVTQAGIVISFFLFAWLFVGKLERFSDCKTLGGVMGKVYGKEVRLFSAALGIVACLMITAGQVGYLRSIAKHMFGITSFWFTLGIGLLLILYMTSGGFRTVALTDVLQLGAFVVVVVLVAEAAIAKLSELSEERGLTLLIKKLKKEGHADKLIFKNHPKLLEGVLEIFIWALLPSWLLSPPVLQRLLMTNKKRNRSVLLSSSVFYSLLRFFLLVIGLSAIFLIPGEVAAIDAEKGEKKWIFTEIVNYLFSDRPWLLGMIVAGVMSIAFSTIDSFVHAAAVLAVYDIKQSSKGSVSTVSSTRQDLRLVRMITVLFILFIISISGNSFNILLYAYALLSLLVIPLLTGIVRNKKGSSRAFGVSVALGFVTFVVVQQLLLYYFGKDIDSSAYAWLTGLAVHAVSFFVVHYLDRKRVRQLQEASEEEGEPFVTSAMPLRRRIRNWLDKIENPAVAAQKKLQQYGSTSFAFTWFTFFLFMVPTWHPDHLFIAGVRVIGVLLCIGLLAKSVWPNAIRPYFALYYFVTIGYCIPFTSILLFLTQADNGMAHTLLLLSFLCLVTLVDWKSFFLLLGLGGAGAMLVYSLRFGKGFLPELSWEEWWDVAVKLFFTTLIGLLFMRRKELHHDKNQRKLLRKIRERDVKLKVSIDNNAQLVDSIDPQSSVISEIAAQIDVLRKEGVSEDRLGRIKSALCHLEEVKTKSKYYLPLQPKQESLATILDNVSQKLEKIGLDETRKVYRKHSQDRVVCDATYVAKLMVNAVQHIVRYHPGQEVHCHLDDTTIDYGKFEGKSQLLPAYRFTISTARQPLEKKVYLLKNLGFHFGNDSKHLTENERIIQAHYGVMLFDEKGSDCIQCYVLPYDLNMIRPKISRFADENLANSTSLNNPEDIAFLHLVGEKNLNLALIKKALLDCKHYHRWQVRKSGEPYYLHPLRIATELLHYTEDMDMVIAGLLHDTVEDTPYTPSQIEARYGKRVRELVVEVTNLYNTASRKLRLQKREKFVAMLEGADKEAMTVKLFDRLDNMRTIGGKSPLKRTKIAQETMDFFVPIARKLDYGTVERELIILCTPYLSGEGASANELDTGF